MLGPIEKLPAIAKSREVEQLLFAIPRLPAARVREILAACADLKLSYKILPVSFAYLNDRVDVSALSDLSPDHLLPRNQVLFDEDELDRLVRGRRILVTGAAGSIGSEACRQIAAHAPGALVLADIDENNLYFLFRDLRRKHPDLAVHAQVVDIRDAPRVEQLLRRVPPARRRPRRRPQARAAHGVRPRGGGQEQRDRLPEPGEGRRPAGGRALRARLDGQGGEPRERDGSHQEGGRAPAPAPRDAVAHAASARSASATCWAAPAASCRSSRSRSRAAAP